MKNYQFVIFFSIVFTVYSLANAYIFFKGYNLITSGTRSKLVYSIIFIILAVSFIAGKFLEATHSSVFSDVLNIIGGFWMGFLFYSFLFLFLSDIVSLVFKATGLIDSNNLLTYKKISFFSTIALSLLMIIGGFINAVIPVVKNYDITIEKKVDGIESLRIAAVSDIHLGSVIRKRSIKKLSSILENLKPEVVFLLGDLVDGEMGPVLRGDLLQYFYAPETKDGLFAITGNHEFIGGAKKTIPYIESKGIRVLKDELVILPGGIQLIGRLDRDSHRFYGKERASLVELTKGIDHSRPVILLDHQPFNLEEPEKHGIDLQLSGHTHNGQMWPLNYLTNKIYELSYGYLRKGNTHIIVSSGYGLWGPRIRSASRSEVLLISVSFSSNNSARE